MESALAKVSEAMSILEELDPEIVAISTVFKALDDLTPDAQSRVLEYVQRKLRKEPAAAATAPREAPQDGGGTQAEHRDQSPSSDNDDTDEDGINAVARRWMRRNGLTSHGLGSIFSLGVDEIELVAKSVPGKTKKDRMHSVILLRGIAAYLSSGVSRFTHAELKEASLHYDAYDVANAATYLKSFASEVSGSAKSGYTLTARGLASATELVKSLAGATE